MLPKVRKLFTLISLGQKVQSHDIECKWEKIDGEGRQEVVRMERIQDRETDRRERDNAKMV